ncbi:MAG: copper homeostasis protein CutC [Candidatus Hinthialibacter antarcticus]|nr:copper homeostasis protein CutC [Candidatus Hinthialibacter antarcticus]
MTKKPFALEVIVNSVQSARAAQAGGADRLEICDNLVEGGTTPSAGMIKRIRAAVEIPIQIMVRPRGGDFCYSADELGVMMYDIETAHYLKADGVVIGLLKPDGSIDVENTKALIEQARPLKVTFHRAFDMTSNPDHALDQLIEMGVDILLTSGLENKALDGVKNITRFVERAGGSLRIMAGSGVNENNAAQIINATGVRDIHVSCRTQTASLMQYKNPNIQMGGSYTIDEYSLNLTDKEKIQRVKKILSTID